MTIHRSCSNENLPLLLSRETLENVLEADAPSSWSGGKITWGVISGVVIVAGAVALAILLSPIGAGIAGATILAACAVGCIVIGGVSLIALFCSSVSITQAPVAVRDEDEKLADDTACEAIKHYAQNCMDTREPFSLNKLPLNEVDALNDLKSEEWSSQTPNFEKLSGQFASCFLRAVFLPRKRPRGYYLPPFLPMMNPTFNAEFLRRINQNLIPMSTSGGVVNKNYFADRLKEHLPFYLNNLSKAPALFICLLHEIAQNHKKTLTNSECLANHILGPILFNAAYPSNEDKENTKLQATVHPQLPLVMIEFAPTFFPEAHLEICKHLKTILL